jgi:predicted outer membrane repeat protein
LFLLLAATSLAITVSTWEALQAQVSSLATGGSIVLTLGHPFEINATTFKATEVSNSTHVTINGNGAVLDAHMKDRFFLVNQASSLTVSKLALQNGHNKGDGDRFGGAVRIDTRSNASFTQCDFVMNQITFGCMECDGRGGAIYMTSGAQLVVLTKCNLFNNGVHSGFFGGSELGGAIEMDGGDLELTTCNFTQNSHGGAVYVGSNAQVRIKDSVFTDNAISRRDCPSTASFHCGGESSKWAEAQAQNLPATQLPPARTVDCRPIPAASPTTVYSWKQFESRIQAVPINGSATMTLAPQFDQSVFHCPCPCTGAFATISDGKHITINGGGGVLDMRKQGRVFLVNKFAELKLSNSVLKNAVGDHHGGAVYIDAGSNASFTECTFDSNTASGDWSASGGAIHAQGGNHALLNLAHCTFVRNSVSSYGGGCVSTGGAIQIQGGVSAKMTDCTFEKNIASAQGSNGGALMHELL